MKITHSFIELKKKLFKKWTLFSKVPDLVVFSYVIMWEMYEYYDIPSGELVELIETMGFRISIKEEVMLEFVDKLIPMISVIEKEMNSSDRDTWVDLYGIDAYKLKFKIVPLLKVCCAGSIDSEQLVKWLVYELNDLQKLLSLNFDSIVSTKDESYAARLIDKNRVSMNFINPAPYEFETHMSAYRNLYRYEGCYRISINLITTDSVKILKLVSESCFFFINFIESSLDVFFRLSDLNTIIIGKIECLQILENRVLVDLKLFDTEVCEIMTLLLTEFFNCLTVIKTFREFTHLRAILTRIESSNSLICCFAHLSTILKSIHEQKFSEDIINTAYKNRFNVIVDMMSVTLLAFNESIIKVKHTANSCTRVKRYSKK